MSLDLVKRSEVGAPLTAVQHDANLTAIETAVNANEVAIGTKETPVGAQAKADAAQAAAIAAAALDATTKANAAQAAAIATAATDATTKANAAQAASLPVNDPSVSNSREWTAPTATQLQAEDSGGTIRLAWTAQRVWQAIAAWWAASAMKTKLDGIATGATANATDAQLRDRSTHTGTQAASTISDFSTAADARISAAAGVSIASLSGGKIPAAQIPDIAISDYLGAAANQAAMLALSGQKGDWCVRTDLGTTWIITGTDPTLLAGWTQLSYPTAPVTSVASKTGAVTLAAADIADSTAAGRAIMTAADAAAQRTAMGAAASGAIGSSNLTMSAARLLGRSTAGTGAPEEITVGSGLTLSGGALTASGGGGSPGGSSGQPQYNNGGALAGMTGVAWDDTNRVLTSDNATHRAWEFDAVNKFQRLYNARIDASNGEWGALRWNANILEIGTYKNGTGATRAISFVINGTAKVDLASGGNVILWAAPTLWYNGSSSMTATVQPNGTGGIFAVNSSGQFNFSSTTTASGSADVGFCRNAAGVAEVNSGTAGTLRDLRLRNLIATQLVQTTALTVATLPAAASWPGAEAYVTDANAPAVGSAVASGGSAKVVVRSNGTSWIVTAII